MKNGEISGLSGILSGMIKAAGEAGVDMITDLINQIIVEGIFPEELELSTVNCFKRKRDSLEKGNYRELKLTGHILKILGRVTENLIKQQLDICLTEALQMLYLKNYTIYRKKIRRSRRTDL